jgi:signal transduction histidine kinase
VSDQNKNRADTGGLPQLGQNPGSAGQPGALVGGIAHDLNTVLTTIYGYCEQVLDILGDDNPEASEQAKRIIAAADRARGLTGQLLSLSHSSAQEKVAVRVADVIADTIDFIRPSVPSGIQILRRLKLPEATIMAVPAQLFRIFLNLLLNASQAIGDREGTITVTLDLPEISTVSGDEENPGFLLITVSDTGNGMDSSTAARIFDPWFTSGRQNGTGLGLTVVSDALREIGGTIRVDSEPGKGATFSMLIPSAFFGSLPEKS